MLAASGAETDVEAAASGEHRLHLLLEVKKDKQDGTRDDTATIHTFIGNTQQHG